MHFVHVVPQVKKLVWQEFATFCGWCQIYLKILIFMVLFNNLLNASLSFLTRALEQSLAIYFTGHVLYCSTWKQRLHNLLSCSLTHNKPFYNRLPFHQTAWEQPQSFQPAQRPAVILSKTDSKLIKTIVSDSIMILNFICKIYELKLQTTNNIFFAKHDKQNHTPLCLGCLNPVKKWWKQLLCTPGLVWVLDFPGVFVVGVCLMKL